MSSLQSVLPELEEKESSGVKVSVFGAGSFGTALSMVLANNGHDVSILARDPAVVESINERHENCKHQSGHVLPSRVTATSDIAECLKGSSLIVHAVPAQNSLDFLSHRREQINSLARNVPIVSVAKGLHVASGGLMMRDVILKGLGDVSEQDRPLAFLSGPSFAKELLDRMPTGVVVASSNADLARRVQKLFSSVVLRVYTSDDVIGVELGGALKNIMAIAAGIVAGCGLGYNTVTGMVTRGLNEMRLLALAMGAQETTIAGLAGVGDLMLTCYGGLSRNRSVGIRLGQGESLEQIIESMSEVAEGVPTAAIAVRLAEQHNLDLPIMRNVHRVINGEQTPKEALVQLMTRPLRAEFVDKQD
jgi:glycerol-3-phosphate dehydrogenase (NAD+)